jgi:hypothetical protein
MSEEIEIVPQTPVQLEHASKMEAATEGVEPSGAEQHPLGKALFEAWAGVLSPSKRWDQQSWAIACGFDRAAREFLFKVMTGVMEDNDRQRAALTEIARLRTDLRGDFSMGSRQSDIARKALSPALSKASQ